MELHKIVKLISALAVMITLTSCKDKATQVISPTSVYVSTISSSDAIEERWFSATVRARVETSFGFRVGGKIVQRFVNIGDHITYGQPLVQLDDADYQLAINAAEDQLKAASVDARQAASDAERFQRLVEDGSMGSADLERQKSRSDAANARKEQVLQALQVAKNKSSYTILKAPYSGVITAINMEVGQVVSEGSLVISISKEDDREVVVDLPEEMVNQAKQFKASALSWDNTGVSVALHLRELSPLAASQTRTYRARFAPNSYSEMARFPLGSTIQLKLSLINTAPDTTIPLNALIKTNGEAGVWALNSTGDGVIFVKVNVLSYATNSIRVTSLPNNIRIVTVGAQKLDPSMKIRPIERKLEDTDNQRGEL